MAIEARIRELDNRRETLDRKIHEESTRPVADTTRLSELKRQKLKLKEEVEALKGKAATAH